MSTANLDESGFGAVELDGKGEDLLEVAEEADRLFEQGVEVDAVTRTDNKANPVLVAGRIVGVDGHKCGGEVGVTVGLLDRSFLQDGVVGSKADKLLKDSGLLWLSPEGGDQVLRVGLAKSWKRAKVSRIVRRKDRRRLVRIIGNCCEVCLAIKPFYVQFLSLFLDTGFSGVRQLLVSMFRRSSLVLIPLWR